MAAPWFSLRCPALPATCEPPSGFPPDSAALPAAREPVPAFPPDSAAGELPPSRREPAAIRCASPPPGISARRTTAGTIKLLPESGRNPIAPTTTGLATPASTAASNASAAAAARLPAVPRTCECTPSASSTPRADE